MEINHGLIPSVSDSLWLGGTIEYNEVLPSGDWRPYSPALEHQADPIETMACVSFSLTDCLELQYKLRGIDINFSDRYLAKTSGTSINGNTLEQVANTARNFGLVTEDQYPNSPKAQTWNQYYAEIPVSIKNLAVKQDFQYESTSIDTENLKTQLKQSPVQITIVAPHPNHAVALLAIEGQTAYIQDHYSIAIRAIPVSQIAYALKIVLNPTPMTNSLIVKNGNEYGIFDPATSEDGLVTLMRNRGMVVPLTPEGKLDWSKVKVDKQLA